ncbi:serine/arginine-rich SC35-like splicing factor SCL28 [Magnolia sinica]|uniref:serine/arginine-rich SC35-like splicing factor SCL28 n=1 Tax=Magnolia sinica TaxID=86752 RepID=UPI0026595751|nr:serine/arginine-rich SC35-like splicing factor SCL28 [Magnolia sinica]
MRGRSLARSVKAASRHHHREPDRTTKPPSTNLHPHLNRTDFTLFVANIPFDCSREDIWGIFSKYGKLLDVYIPSLLGISKPRGYAFIRFLYEQDAVAAKYLLNDCRINSRIVSIRWVRAKRFTTDNVRVRIPPHQAQPSRKAGPLPPTRSYMTAATSSQPVPNIRKIRDVADGNPSPPSPPTTIADPTAVAHRLHLLSLVVVGCTSSPLISVSWATAAIRDSKFQVSAVDIV